MVHASNVTLKKSFSGAFIVAQGWKRSFLPYLKASETNSALTSEDRSSREPLERKSAQNSTFPNGFEALVSEVCDETNIAEFKMKIGDFEMHLKRDIESPRTPSPCTPIVSPTMAPPIPSEPMNESGDAAQPVVSQKSPPEAATPFANISSAKASKLAALEASVSNAYVLVPSPTVGTFRRGRTLKGKRQPPSCKEGDIIKEGQTIGFLDQFGNELPVKSDVAGEVLKVLYRDGEAVGYGDPLVAVLPSFHGIE